MMIMMQPLLCPRKYDLINISSLLESSRRGVILTYFDQFNDAMWA